MLLILFIGALFDTVLCKIPAIVSVPDEAWQQLSDAVQGRLYSAFPIAQSCFPTFDGRPSTINAFECAIVEDNYTNRSFRVALPGAFMQTEWETCQSTGAQCLLDPSDTFSSFPEQQESCDQGIVSRRYIEVIYASDVQAAFAFSKQYSVPVVIKNTGHDYKGRSSAPYSLSLWVDYNQSFVSDGCDGSTPIAAVTYGAGVTFDSLYSFANAHNFTIVGGSDPSVGAAGGFLQAGGHSAISNTFGLGVDRVLQYKIVTPTGSYLTANQCQNSDLFWALRGAGGGTFGVVMEASVSVAPAITPQVVVLAVEPTAESSRALWTVVLDNSAKWIAEGWGASLAYNTVLYMHPTYNATEATASMQWDPTSPPLLDFAVRHAEDTLELLNSTSTSFLDFFTTFLEPSLVPVGENLILASRFIPFSNVTTNSSRSILLEAIMESFNYSTQMQIYQTTPFVYSLTNNLTEQSSADSETSINPLWRTSAFHAVQGQTWAWNASLEETRQTYSLVSASMDPIRKVTPVASYQNEGDVHEPSHQGESPVRACIRT